MLDRIKDILATIGIGIAILFLCAVFVTRVSWLGVFILSALYLSIHIYYQVTDSGKSKADGIMFSGIYVVLIIMSLYQYSVDSEKIEQDQYLNGQEYGYEEGYAEGYRDAMNEIDSLFY